MNNFRRWMTLAEGGAARMLLYHGSKKAFPVGFILTPQTDGYVHGVYGDELDKLIRKTERILEKYRPTTMISRLQSVFLVARVDAVEWAGGQADYIYQVEPIGAAEESCLWWYQELENLAYQPRLDRHAAKTAAINYWTNAPPPQGKPATYEFRCRQATVVAIVRQPMSHENALK
jgi:hypothetical protein